MYPNDDLFSLLGLLLKMYLFVNTHKTVENFLERMFIKLMTLIIILRIKKYFLSNFNF